MSAFISARSLPADDPVLGSVTGQQCPPGQEVVLKLYARSLVAVDVAGGHHLGAVGDVCRPPTEAALADDQPVA